MPTSEEKLESLKDLRTTIQYALLLNKDLPIKELTDEINKSLQPSLNLLMQFVEVQTLKEIYEQMCKKI